MKLDSRKNNIIVFSDVKCSYCYSSFEELLNYKDNLNLSVINVLKFDRKEETSSYLEKYDEDFQVIRATEELLKGFKVMKFPSDQPGGDIQKGNILLSTGWVRDIQMFIHTKGGEKNVG